MKSESMQDSNLYHNLMRLSRYSEARLMHSLEEKGYKNLKMSYAAPLMHITLSPIRLNDLAVKLGISKQLCNQNLRPIEHAKLIERFNDPEDGRAKLIKLSNKGLQLVSDAVEDNYLINDTFQAAMGDKEFSDLTANFNKLSRDLGLIERDTVDLPLVTLLSFLWLYSEKRLMNLTKLQGYQGLQMSYGQVLSHISVNIESGITISDIAQLNNVSIQAISRTAKEIEKLGFIKRHRDPEDKRNKQLKLTEDGLDLINASIKSSQTLDKELTDIIGLTAFETMKHQIAGLCQLTIPANTATSQQRLKILNEYIKNYASNPKKNKRIAEELLHYIDEPQLQQLDTIIDSLITDHIH